MLKAKALLSEQWNPDSLRETLITIYKMSNQDCDQRMQTWEIRRIFYVTRIILNVFTLEKRSSNNSV